VSPRPPSRLAVIGTLAGFQIVLVGLVDFLTGPDLGFFVFYFLPIGYAAWRAGRLAGGIASVLSASLWLIVDVASQPAGIPLAIEFWNAGIRLLAFLAFAFSFARVRELLEVERELSRRLQESLGEVRELSGLLPICAACKKIRNDEGYWQQIETYIGTHSRAEFTHGICPGCARRLYPEYVGSGREHEKEREEKHPEEPMEGPDG
jgi:hypothetical protein